MDPNCIFCKIINKEIPSDIVYEDSDVVAFLDIHPVTRGHALVVPKKHSQDLTDTDEETIKNFFVTAAKVAQAVSKAVNAAGFNFSVNNGAASGQIIFHLHVHIIPRFASDNLKPWPHSEIEPKTRAEIAEKIKKNL